MQKYEDQRDDRIDSENIVYLTPTFNNDGLVY